MPGLTDKHKARILYPNDTGDSLAKVRRLRNGRKRAG